MFQTQTEFEAYLAETRAACPRVPTAWEEVSYRSPRGELMTGYVTAWFKAVPDTPPEGPHSLSIWNLPTFVQARAERKQKGHVRVEFCRPEEATHVELQCGGIPWLGKVALTGGVANVGEDRFREVNGHAEMFLEEAKYNRIEVAAR